MPHLFPLKNKAFKGTRKLVKELIESVDKQ